MVELPDSVPAKPRLLERLRHALRLGHYSSRTEEAYVLWVRRFIVFHGRRHPETMAEAEVVAFLTHLAVRETVSASTQNQAFAAITFLYRYVLERPLGPLGGVARARMPQRLPVVLSRDEIRVVLSHLRGQAWIVVTLLYGAGLRLNECLELRVKDVDDGRSQITVRRGKGGKDRVVPLPVVVKGALAGHRAHVRRLHRTDLAAGCGRVVLPDALCRKFPNAPTEWAWQFLFPAARICRDSRSGGPTRFHLHETAIQREVKRAVLAAGVAKRVGCHTFRSVSTWYPPFKDGQISTAIAPVRRRAVGVCGRDARRCTAWMRACTAGRCKSVRVITHGAYSTTWVAGSTPSAMSRLMTVLLTPSSSAVASSVSHSPVCR